MSGPGAVTALVVRLPGQAESPSEPSGPAVARHRGRFGPPIRGCPGPGRGTRFNELRFKFESRKFQLNSSSALSPGRLPVSLSSRRRRSVRRGRRPAGELQVNLTLVLESVQLARRSESIMGHRR